ncbi:MAG TPA: YciI family protein [Streptosporangiaceae bacterium]|nr:YciI family protein [Streptosporangiaceae bacterium]
MTKYLLALYKADDELIPPERSRQVWAGVNALGDKMTDAGAFVFKSGLRGGGAAATVVRQSGDDFLITDGPYTETKEHLAGFWIINAADLDEALEWAKQAAVAELRPIEVRPFFEGDLDDAIGANAADTADTAGT